MKQDAFRESFDTSSYQQPQQTWACGHLCEGQPCPIGPNGNGECIVHQICSPVLIQSVWHCTRAKAWGGKCQDGPVPDPTCPDQRATCPHQPTVCQPQRTLRSKRNLVTGLTAALALALCLVILGGSSRNSNRAVIDTSSIVSPGELTTHHATLEQGCAACHSAASSSPLDLLSCAFGSNGSLTDSHKCLECHHQFGQHALYAHSVNPDELTRRSQAVTATGASQTARQKLARFLNPHVTTESVELACSTCHVEHRGAAVNLAELTNAQCQSCHSSGFHSFSDGHSEFSKPKRAFLYFDHSTHFERHFKDPDSTTGDSVTSHACAVCHIQDAAGETMVLASFEKTCSQCHSKQITDDHLPVEFKLPGSSFFTFDVRDPATLPPFMELLLLADSDAVAAMKLLALPRDDPADAAAITQAHAAISAGVQNLFQELMSQGEDLLLERLSQLPDHQPDAAKLAERLAKQLSDSGFLVALQHGRIHKGNIPAGGWSLSDDGLTLVYRSRGHADLLLKECLNFAAAGITQYPASPAAGVDGVFDRLFQQLAAPEATGHCMKCHTLDALPGDRKRINWKSRQVASAADGFTRFVHGPHVTFLSSEYQAQAIDSSPDNRCETCHAVSHYGMTLRKSEFLLNDWMPSPHFDHSESIGLKPVSRQSCVKCHTASGAGDSCLQCHNYHVHPTMLNER